MPKLPKCIYVKWDGPERERYLNANVEASNLLEYPEDQEILGVYELKRQIVAKSTVSISEKGKTTSAKR